MNGEALKERTNQTGLAIVLATAVMLFTAFAASYLVRRAGADWQPVTLPSLLWANTLVILVSSVALEIGRRRGSRTWVVGAFVLGVLFAGGQLLAWIQLASEGILLPTNPHSSFFYVLTGVHAAHLIGGLIALAVALRRSVLGAMSLMAVYWHFIGGLWLSIFGLLSVL